jgi:Tol biopolymer transport system component
VLFGLAVKDDAFGEIKTKNGSLMNIILKFSLALAASASLLAQSGADLLQQALRKEEVEGDLKGAIALYQKIANTNGASRSLAAKALVQMGKGYEKLGAADARAAYQKVISEFADQSKEVSEAKMRLAALAKEAQPAEAGGQPIVRLIVSDKTDNWIPFGDSTPSPNGKYIAYINWDHGNLGFYNIETGEKRDLTTEGTWNGKPDQFTYGGIWSPDSASLAYLWRMGPKSEVRVVHRDGGKYRVLVADNIFPQAWSKDGKIIAQGPYRTGANGRERPEGILMVDSASGSTNMLKQLPDAGASVRLSLSPDGKYIAYSYARTEKDSTNTAKAEIRVMNIDGSDDHLLIEHPADDVMPVWMADGKHLVFLSDRSGADALWAIRVLGGIADGEAHLVRDGIERGVRLGVTDDGTVFFFAKSPSFNIYTAEANFDEATLGTPKLASLRYDGKNRNPRWSSDGSKLGYESWRNPHLLVFQDAATGKEEDIKTEWGFGARPAWSPDLSRLVGPAPNPAKQGRALFNVDVKSGRRSLLTAPADDAGYPIFTPDGKYLIYGKFSWSTNQLPNQLIELNLATREERLISREIVAYNRSLAISPDGSRIATCTYPYPLNDEHKTKLMVGSRSDGSVKMVAEFPISEMGRGYALDWLPDNRRVIVAFDGKKGQQLYIADVETGSSRTFGPTQSKDEPIHSLSVHPDGKRIAFERGKMIRELWSMKNFIAEEKVATAK